MNTSTAIQIAHKLWVKWVSARPAIGRDGYLRSSDDMAEYRFYDIPTIHDSMLREYRWIRTGKAKVTPGLVREVRGELILLGKVRRALA